MSSSIGTISNPIYGKIKNGNQTTSFYQFPDAGLVGCRTETHVSLAAHAEPDSTSFDVGPNSAIPL